PRARPERRPAHVSSMIAATPLVEAQIPDQARAHGLSVQDALEQVILAPHVIKDLIEPSEVADVVAFLAGPGGRSFTGVPVTMDMGWTAR
ncbi:MAG TPA: hypothetical protein VE127_06615, partial [Solirubrobacteraceae bacterium]|nr:hypothetical protein [Solirubrobacteraceae bacterium]